MEIPLSQPLLMDGAARTNLWLEGMPMYSCPAQWMLEHPERVQKLQREFLQAGSPDAVHPDGTGGQCDPAKVGRTAADGAVQRAAGKADGGKLPPGRAENAGSRGDCTAGAAGGAVW